MKKLVSALAIACVGTLAFADDAQWSTSWIQGIGTGAASATDLKPTGGTWSGITSDNATFESSALTLDLDTTEEAKFTVSAETTAKTAQKLTIKGVFTPCAASDLLTGTEMNNKNAQVGFAVVTQDSSSKYYAWVGETTKSTNGSAINDWVELGTCADASAVTDLTITMNYWASSASATFAISGVTISTPTYSLTSTAASNYKVASIACTGSGSLTALNGVTGVAVATVGDVAYATVDDAIAAVKENGGTVEVVVAPSGDVDGGKEGTVDTTKECVVAKDGAITVQTKTSILEAITFNGVALKANVSALRTFLSENCSSVYTGTDSTIAKLQAALEKTPEDAANKLALWQDYALGIKPSTKLEMGYTTDSATDGVTVKLATTVAPSGDYKITYKCAQVDGNAADVVSTDASAIKLPLTTGRYKVNVVFSAPDATQN